MHCCQVTLIGPSSSRRKICALRDTGALQLLLSEQSVSECDYEYNGEFRMIRGVTGETVSIVCGDAFPIERVLVATYLLSVEALPHCR